MAYATEITMSDNESKESPLDNVESKKPPFSEVADRKRGMLTRTDRELILGKKEYSSKQSRRNARHRVREHIRHALHDVSLVANQIDGGELEQLIQRKRQILQEDEQRTAEFCYEGLVQLAGRLIPIETEEIESVESETRIDFTHRIEKCTKWMIRAGAEQSLDDGRVATDITVDVSIEIEDKNKTMQELTSGENDIQTFTTHIRNIGGKELQEYLREMNETVNVRGFEHVGPDHTLIKSFITSQED